MVLRSERQPAFATYPPTVCSITPKIGWCLSSSAQMRTVSPAFRNGVSGLPPRIVSIVRISARQE
jgi:hypothetical protein